MTSLKHCFVIWRLSKSFTDCSQTNYVEVWGPRVSYGERMRNRCLMIANIGSLLGSPSLKAHLRYFVKLKQDRIALCSAYPIAICKRFLEKDQIKLYFEWCQVYFVYTGFSIFLATKRSGDILHAYTRRELVHRELTPGDLRRNFKV